MSPARRPPLVLHVTHELSLQGARKFQVLTPGCRHQSLTSVMLFVTVADGLLHFPIPPVYIPPRSRVTMHRFFKVFKDRLRTVSCHLKQLQRPFRNCPFCEPALVREPNRL